MSWKDKLENIVFEIRTGDGKVYKPLWKNAEKGNDFNASRYDFINLEGTLVDRKKPQGNIYPLIFWFQGDDNIEQSSAFEESTKDSRMWTIEHPFYGTIKGQPSNFKRNDNSYNVTEITVDFWESIDGNFPSDSISIVDTVKVKSLELKTISAAMFESNVKPKASDIDLLKRNLTLTSSKFSPNLESFNDFNNVRKSALLAADRIVFDTGASFTTMQRIYEDPVFFSTPVLVRLKAYVRAYEIIKESIKSRFSKYNFESESASIFVGICNTCVNGSKSDYITRDDVKQVNIILLDTYKDYIKTLDENQVDIFDVRNAWAPEFNIQKPLLDLVTFTSKSLFELSFDSKQERFYELTEDSNLIILTHRFMGLDEFDENLETLRRINNIKNSEIYKIPKGRVIKYFA